MLDSQTPYQLLASSQSVLFSSSTLNVSSKSSAASTTSSLPTTVSSHNVNECEGKAVVRPRIVSHESQYGVPLPKEVRETLFRATSSFSTPDAARARLHSAGNEALQRSRSQPSRRSVRWAASNALAEAVAECVQEVGPISQLQRGHCASKSLGDIQTDTQPMSPLPFKPRRVSMDTYDHSSFSGPITASSNSGPWFKKIFRHKHSRTPSRATNELSSTGGIFELYRQSTSDGYAFCSINVPTEEVLLVRTPHVLRGWKATISLPDSTAPIISLRRRHAFDTTMTQADGSPDLSLCQRLLAQPELEFSSPHESEVLFWKRRGRDGALLLSSHQFGTTRAVYRPYAGQGRKLGKLEILISRDRRDVSLPFAAATLFAYLAILGGPEKTVAPVRSTESVLEPALPPKHNSTVQRLRNTRKAMVVSEQAMIGIAA